VDEVAFMKSYARALAQAIKAGWYDTIPETNYQILQLLKSRGFLVALLSSRSQTEMSHLMEAHHQLAAYIDQFYYLENCQFHKPDGRVFDGLLEDFRVSKEQVVYVGDSVSDAKACEEAGIVFIASLESGLRCKADFEGLPVERFITTLAQLLDFV
jgi:HAD superfamily hydrolase (TIGR01549 family)